MRWIWTARLTRIDRYSRLYSLYRSAQQKFFEYCLSNAWSKVQTKVVPKRGLICHSADRIWENLCRQKWPDFRILGSGTWHEFHRSYINSFLILPPPSPPGYLSISMSSPHHCQPMATSIQHHHQRMRMRFHCHHQKTEIMTGLRCIVDLSVPPPPSETTHPAPTTIDEHLLPPSMNGAHGPAASSTKWAPTTTIDAWHSGIQQHHQKTTPSAHKHPQVPTDTNKWRQWPNTPLDEWWGFTINEWQWVLTTLSSFPFPPCNDHT